MKTLTLFIALLVCASAGAQLSRPGSGLSAASAGAQIRDTLEAQTEVFFVFGFGAGAGGDTAVCADSAYYGGFFNPTDTLEITSLRCVMGHGIGTDTLTFQVSWGDSVTDAAPVVLNTTPLAITSITTGTVDASFNNAKIPPGVWVWGTTPTVVDGRKPVWLLATMSGKRIKP